MLSISSNNKLTTIVIGVKPVNVETLKKNINVTSSKTTNLDKSTPNYDIFTETEALKDNSSSKLNLTFLKMYQNPLTVVSYLIHESLINQFVKCHMLYIKDSPSVEMIMSEARCSILFIKTT